MRYNQLRNTENLKDALLEDLLDKCTELQFRNEDLTRQLPPPGVNYKQVATTLTDMINRQTLLVALIDGNSLIFQSYLLKQGSKGGQQAASIFRQKLMEWASTAWPRVAMDGAVVRVFANVKVLAEKCRKANLVPSTDVFEAFVQGFNNGEGGLFDFVDVGGAPDGVVTKMTAELQYHSLNYQSGHVLFGCGNDKAFVQTLEGYVDNVEMLGRLSLLELEPFENEDMANMPFERKKLQGIFRDSHKPLPNAPEVHAEITRKDSRNMFNPQSGVFTPQQSPFSPRPVIPAVAPSPAPSLRNDLTRTNSHASSSAFSEVPSSVATNGGNVGGGGWANIARGSAHLPFKDLTSKPAPPETVKITGPVVRQNKLGQRIDAEMEYNHEKVYELKKMKYCNQHYIGRGCCQHSAGNGACPHRHEPKLNKDDLKWLRVVARETVCKKGTACTEIDCIYGHHCPYPKVQEGSNKGIACINGDNCRFGSEMHGMDTVVDRILRAEDVE
ncbi:hypothetical protein M409DRAFT_70078 [Zasmidium cellare ATCC 36951]|uniref:C3H1-type domain-containing protein n=1 Tax=Zasmidium cellare ATCC 36951 TaxID=1080233 RepID=A0A6A6C1S8_ZASCE|nr:uncharacterized protein M409DRAFT_70078 [Zasmidium cellare ATCC 36951]KAF2161004.1 hypothetical protein M409DRAFT_70078 [Zasmidium cellare ATCC 36951]